MKRAPFAVFAVAGGLASSAVGYWYCLRPRMLRWGATIEEARRTLPGDDLVPQPQLQATHAITINALPESVWPWLVQIGQGRGGFYSYEWLEDAMDLDIHNADRILPEFQNLQAGDLVPFTPEQTGIPVAVFEPHRTLALHADSRQPVPGLVSLVKDPGQYFNVLWAFHLFPQGAAQTRFIERWRVDWSPSLQSTAFMRGFLEPGAFIMERKMLLGVKERVEAAGRETTEEAIQ